MKCNWPQASHHYIIEYNLFYKRWLRFSLQTDRVLFVRYIDLLMDVEKETGRLESVMSLDRKFLSYFNPSKVTKVPISKKFSNDRRNYYLNEEYFKSYTMDDLEDLNKLIDPEVISGLNYKKRG